MDDYDTAYSKILFPGQPVVFGVRLEKFITIGTGLLLTRIKSPLIYGGELPAGELCRSIYILSRSWQKAERGLCRRSTGRLLKLWGWQIKIFCDPVRRMMATETLGSYVREAFEDKPPTTTPIDAKVTTCKLPLLLLQKVRLMHYLNCSREEALNYPLRESWWDIAGLGEEQNKLDILTKAQAEFIAKS